MYKILLVTDRPEVLDAFAGVNTWETLGFRAPRICNSAESAISCLKAHHVDGIGIALEKQEEALLNAHLMAFILFCLFLPSARMSRSCWKASRSCVPC